MAIDAHVCALELSLESTESVVRIGGASTLTCSFMSVKFHEAALVRTSRPRMVCTVCGIVAPM